MTREEFQTERTRIISEMLDNPDEYGIYPTTKCFEQLDALFDSLSLPPAEGATDKFRDVLHEVQRLIETEGGATESEMKAIWNSLSCAITESERRQQPTAEGAEEILESIVESLGEPINIHNHIFEIRPYTVEHKTEWWIFHKEVGSGEPLAQWLQNFATLHAQRIADKMVSERLREELTDWADYWNKLETGHACIMKEDIDEYLKTREK